MASSASTRPWLMSSLAIALVLGILLRILPLLGLDFPLGDGGMFAVMAEDLRSGSFGLPAFTSYNGGDIPFAYPPLGIYALAVVPGSPVATEAWLPLIWSALAIVAFWTFARAVFEDEAAGVATIAFALLPGAYAWQIMGGGVTRGLEQMFSLLALASIARLLDAPRPSRALIAIVCAGLAGLSHPFAPMAVGLGGVTLWVFRSRSMRGALWLAIVAIGSVAVMAPWLAVVTSQHGVQPFVAALETHVGVPERWVAVVVALILSTMVAWVALPISDQLNLRVPFLGVLLTVAFTASVASRWVPGSVMYAVPPEVRGELTALTTTTSRNATFAVWTGNIGDDHIVEWFPALTGRVSVGTYQGAEWRGDWAETVATHIAIQECRCANGADALWMLDRREP